MMAQPLDYDAIAAWIHASYQQAHPGSAYEAFERLPEFLKADNRDAAIRMGEVLAIAGFRLEPRDGQEWTRREQDAVRALIEEHIDLLAEAEHDGWVESRERNGWVLGTRKDVDKREHHLLAPYRNFTEQIQKKQKAHGAGVKEDGSPMSVEQEVEHEKNKDRQSVRKFVDIIARTEYRIVRES